ncbi:helix-turn-helix domain-containing protein [Nonomuraea sp. NEAU-A123]|uniref:helix-turn-helix domain-containing protein n=1 Tax=Nonomuraea sp. NEAU-A123 TaxID=2839649 RepID=UPI001BE49B42|nr:helix-turn-helix domain-containing protein [Nonomuraea sp. NEAU-A123]MBT2229921.1 helix-turn-helix domain-containing protein [Nonomuraea sp. NEAU-A123]
MTAEEMSVPAAELTIVGHFDNRPGYVTRRVTGSPSWLLMWTQDGAGLVEQAGVSFTAGPGDLVVLGSGAAQHYRVAPGAERWCFWWAHFQPRPAWLGWLAEYARATGCHLVHGVPDPTRDQIDEAFDRASRNARWLPPAITAVRPTATHTPPAVGPAAVRPLREYAPAVAVSGPARDLVLNAVEEVILLATAAARPSGDARRAEERGDARVHRALALIAAEPGAQHSVASLARAVALSPSRFAHLFTEETGHTPMRAVRRARIQHAARLLEVTDMDVGQVAAASGFVSPFHFSRAFSHEYGMPPRDFRSRLRPNA